MKIAVFGGAGFIGSHLVDKLIELGHEVTVIDNLSTGKIENLNPKALFFPFDICNGFMLSTLKGFDYVFHLAAIPRVPYSVEHPLETSLVNIEGTLTVLNLAKNIGAKKVIFASSSSVYGDQRLPYKETKRPKPKSPYALQKLVGEQYMKLFDELYGLPTLSLRFFNVYGKRCDPNSEYSLVIGKFFKQKKEGKPFTIYGDGNQTRDFTYVSDVVSACILAMESPAHNKVINICNGHNVSINKIADLIGGKKQYLEPRKGDVLHTKGDNAKAKALLKWRPKVSIEQGLKLMEG